MLEGSFGYKILKVILYLLLLTPLWVSRSFLFPFITTKVLYFRLLVELALVVYLFLAFRYPEIRPRWNWLTIVVWAYFGIMLLAAVFGVNFSKSMLGTIERGEGVVTMLHYGAYFLLLPLVFRTRREWFWYLLTTVSVIGVVSLYAVGQLAGIELFFLAGLGRISGTIGNAAFMAAVTLFGVFLSWYLLYERKFLNFDSKFLQYYLWSLIALFVIVLYYTETRGAIVALVFVLTVYLLFAFWRMKNRKAQLAAFSAALIIVLSGFGLYMARDTGFVLENNTLRRLASISRDDTTTQSRLDTWGASWEGWKDRFWLGYGYENYNIAFNKHFPARIYKKSGSQIWFDRAHNVVFDVGLTSGIFGLIAYLSIFVTAFLILYRWFRYTAQSPPENNKPKPKFQNDWRSPMVLGVLLLAYFIQNLFVFDTHATYLMFFLLLGYIVFLAGEGQGQPLPLSKKRVQAGFLVGAVFVGLMIFTAYQINMKPAFANLRAVEGIRAAASGQARQVLPIFKDALSYGTYMDEEIRQRFMDSSSEVIVGGGLALQEQRELYDFMISQLEKNVEIAPLDARNYLYLMSALTRVEQFWEGSAKRVIDIGEQALALSPTRPQLYFEMGQASFIFGDFERGLEYFQKAVALNPKTRESHFNLLVASILAERFDLTQEQTRIITEDMGYEFDLSDYMVLARSYSQIGRYDVVVEHYLRAVKLEPKDPQLRARLAAAYGELCDLDLARAQVQEAIALDSAFLQEGRLFLQNLEQLCQ